MILMILSLYTYLCIHIHMHKYNLNSFLFQALKNNNDFKNLFGLKYNAVSDILGSEK